MMLFPLYANVDNFKVETGPQRTTVTCANGLLFCLKLFQIDPIINQN